MIHNKTVRAVYDHHLTAKEYTKDKSFVVMATALYGSQNYGLATEASDFDTKTLVFPTYSAIAHKLEMSKALHVRDGLVEIKDFRDMFAMWRKGSLNFLEVLYTHYWEASYFFADSWAEMRAHREIIARAYPRNVLMATLGNVRSNYRRNTVKALANAYSAFDTARDYYDGVLLENCLVSPRHKELKALKYSEMSAEEITERFNVLKEEVEEFADVIENDDALDPNKEYVSEVNALQYRVLVSGLRDLYI